MRAKIAMWGSVGGMDLVISHLMMQVYLLHEERLTLGEPEVEDSGED